MASAPIAYVPRGMVQRMGIVARCLAAAVALACASVLVAGAWMRPDPSGMGTHTALGLQPCQFLYRAGLPCPTCGMTTSVSYFAHGNLVASLWVQPMGAVIGIALALTFWISLYLAITGLPALRLLWIIPTRYYLLPMMFFAIAAWGWKIFIHWQGIDGWK